MEMMIAVRDLASAGEHVWAFLSISTAQEMAQSVPEAVTKENTL